MEKKKLIYLEAMRALAIFFVIFNHSGKNGFTLFTGRTPGSFLFWADLFWSICCKVAVPLFMAISGALMLGRSNESLKDLWLKRILKYAVILVVCSVLYYFWDLHMGYYPEFSPKQFVTTFYSTKVHYHLWFLYLYLAYLIVLPFLRAIAQNLKPAHFVYLIVIAVFMSGIIPGIDYVISKDAVAMNKNFKITWVTNSAVIYPLVGFYLQNKLDFEKVRKKLPFIWLINLAGIAATMALTYLKGMDAGSFDESASQTFFESFVLLNVIALYVTFNYFAKKIQIPRAIARIISAIGMCSFGIYLIHPFIFDQPFMQKLSSLVTGSIAYTMLICLINMIISGLITFIYISAKKFCLRLIKSGKK